ncbi:grpE protein homolog 1, mitochondrial-like [Haliotis rubra]|uniref:grpE protein homolog 1, mitochondrial-like n=1 Tax=Haliotis rubra TaxID=36100 RepID=UPI001EE561FD|nr:grpE protein homolog 1, mitochondrial-like [Haliotis rubra]
MAATMSMCVRQVMKIPHFSQSVLFRSPSRCCRVRMTTTATDGKPSTTAEQKPTEEKPSESAPVEETSAVEKQLVEDKAKLEVQVADFKDKYVRSLAETENVRQRMKKQVEDAKIFGIQAFCKDMLEVADILGKANESVPQQEISNNPHLKNLFDGLTMTESQLQKVFIRHGLHKISPSEGDKFDPYLHEALFEVPTTEKEGGTVAVVQKIGYKLQERTIRPALVGVFKS